MIPTLAARFEPQHNARMASPTGARHRDRTMTGAADTERFAQVVALAWRPAWSMRRRVGCLEPLVAGLKAWLRRSPKDAKGDHPT